MPNTPRPRRPGGHARVTTASLEAMADDVLLAPVAAARNRIQNPRELSDRVAFGKALWRELVIGFAAQLGEVRLGEDGGCRGRGRGEGTTHADGL